MLFFLFIYYRHNGLFFILLYVYFVKFEVLSCLQI